MFLKKTLSQSIKTITSTHGDHNSCASVAVSYQGIPLNSTLKITTSPHTKLEHPSLGVPLLSFQLRLVVRPFWWSGNSIPSRELSTYPTNGSGETHLPNYPTTLGWVGVRSLRVSLNIGISGDVLKNFVRDATGTENWTSSHKVTMFIVESSKEELHLHPISHQTNEAKTRPPEPVTRIESRVASNFL